VSPLVGVEITADDTSGNPVSFHSVIDASRSSKLGWI
jgi:hypothetical protein